MFANGWESDSFYNEYVSIFMVHFLGWGLSEVKQVGQFGINRSNAGVTQT